MKLYGDLLCNHMQLRDAKIHSGDTFPADAVEGQLFYRDDLHELYYFNGTSWNQVLVGTGGGGGGVGSGHVTTLIVDGTSDLGRHVYIRDEMITLNHGETGAGILQWGTTRGGIEIDRGTENMVSLFYDELDDVWKLTNDGTTDEIIVTENNDTVFLRLDGTNTPTTDISWNLHKITNAADPTDPQDYATKNYVDSMIGVGMFLALDGSNSPTADISWSNHQLKDLADPTDSQDAVTLQYLNNELSSPSGSAFTYFLRLDGSNSPSNDISWNGNKITDLASPTDANDGVNKDYVDGYINNLPNVYLALDGSNAPNNDISWNGYKITNLGDPVNDGDAVNRGFVYSNFALAGHTHDYSTILNRPEDDDFHTLDEKTTVDDNDELLIYSVSDARYMKIRRNLLISGSSIVTSSIDLFIFGGFDGGNYLDNAAGYDSSADTWSISITDMPSPQRANISAGRLSDNIYIVAGYNGLYLVNNDQYNITTDTWQDREDIITPSRADHIVLSDDSFYLYVVNGYNATGNIADCDRYDEVGNSWNSLTDALSSRSSISGGHINNTLYIFDGYDGSSVVDTAEKYDITIDTWTGVSNTSGIPKRDSAYSVIDNDKIIIAGGYDGALQVRTVQIFDSSSETWTTVTDVPLPGRTDATGTTYSSTYFEIVAGFDGTYYLRDNDNYDYTTDSWSMKINIPSPGRNDLASSSNI